MRIKGRLKNIEPIGFDLNDSVTLMLKDYYSLIEQAERVHELEQQNKNYRKVIKECVERMNAGGAGTRSFVYKKLIETLEGE